MRPFGIALTMADASALAAGWGAGTRISLGDCGGNPDILAPAEGILPMAALRDAAGQGCGQYVFTFGNNARPPEPAIFLPVIEALIHATGTGFAAACLAAPARGRTLYQGQLFEGARLQGDLPAACAREFSGRVGVIPAQITAAGAPAIRARLAALKEQGYALALVDALADNDCAAIGKAFADQPVIAGPAWTSNCLERPEPASPTGPLAIMSGALDRQSLFQIGGAASIMPLLQLDFSAADPVAAALEFAAPKIGSTPFIIAAAATPDHLAATKVEGLIVNIARQLLAAGIARLVLTGSDTAAAIIGALEAAPLVAGAAFGPFRWLQGSACAYLVKPGSTGARDLFITEFGPQIRLNAAAE